jgi:hypothetical protein
MAEGIVEMGGSSKREPAMACLLTRVQEDQPVLYLLL